MTSTKFTNYVSSIALTLFSLCWSVFANAAGDPEAGKLQAMVCAGCHGLDGATPVLPEYPNLAGQNENTSTISLPCSSRVPGMFL